MPAPIDLNALTADRFEAALGTALIVRKNDGSVESWSIVEVKRRAAHALRADPPFNVYFSAPTHAGNRVQGIRAMRFGDSEWFELFAVPVAASNEATTFEVIFN
jgi:hypothetical protein